MTRSNKAGGWGAGNDDQACPECGRKICGAKKSVKSNTRNNLTESGKQGCSRKTEVCHNPAGMRTPHQGYGKCSRHMGSTDTGIQAAGRQQVRQEMRQYGVPVEIDPEEALREEIHRTVGHVRWLADQVANVGVLTAEEEAAQRGGEPNAAKVIDIGRTKRAEQEDSRADHPAGSGIDVSQSVGVEALVWGVTERETQAGGPGGGFDRVKVQATANVWLQVYMAERGHLAKITDIAMKAGLEARRLDWAEAMAGRLIDAFEDMADRLGVDSKSPEVQAAIAASLEQCVGPVMRSA